MRAELRKVAACSIDFLPEVLAMMLAEAYRRGNR
jgi:hypothetical protein